MSEAPSPLLATDPASLDLVFTSGPTTLSDAHLNGLILELRRRRNEFLSSEAAKSLAPKKVKPKLGEVTPTSAVLADKPPAELDLGDI